METFVVPITTDGSGAGTSDPVHMPTPMLFCALKWDPGTLDSGVDPVLTVVNAPDGTDTILWDEDDVATGGWRFPRAAEHSSGGTALTSYTMFVVDGDLQLSVTNGGAAATGSITFYLVNI